MALFVLMVLLVVFFKNITLAKWKDGSYPYNNYDESEHFNKYAAMSIISGVLSVIFIIITACSMEVMIQGFINPHYGAIQDIVTMFK